MRVKFLCARRRNVSTGMWFLSSSRHFERKQKKFKCKHKMWAWGEKIWAREGAVSLKRNEIMLSNWKSMLLINDMILLPYSHCWKKSQRKHCYSLYIVYSTNNPVLFWYYWQDIYWLSVSLSACSSVVSGLSQSDWSDGCWATGRRCSGERSWDESQSSQSVYVHLLSPPSTCLSEILLTAALHHYLGNY